MRGRNGAPTIWRRAGQILTALFLFVALILYVLDVTDDPRLRGIKAATVDRIAPSFDALSGPARFFQRLTGGISEFSDLYAENTRLRKEVERLQGWIAYANKLEAENAKLSALHNVSLPTKLGDITAEALADSGGPFQRTVLVNVGLRDGAQDGSAVVDGAGMIGRVAGIGDRSARVQLLTDPSSRTPVVTQPGDYRGVLVGDGGPQPRLEFILPNADIAVGARVVTSGDGGVLPRGLPIGEIADIRKREIRVRLAADLNGIEFVRLLRYERSFGEGLKPELVIRKDRPAAGAAQDPAQDPAQDAGAGRR